MNTTKREAERRLRQAEQEAHAARAACDGYARDFGMTPTSIEARERLRAANVALEEARGAMRSILPSAMPM